MGKNLPYATGCATALIAGKPHGYWRRDPESNRARRICNPASASSGACRTEGERLAWASWTAVFASSCPRNYLTPCEKSTCMDEHVRKYRLVNVCRALRQFRLSLQTHAFPAARQVPDTPEAQQFVGFLRFSVRARIDTANGPCRGRTQDSDGALSRGAPAFRRDRRKPASRPIPRLAHDTGAGQYEYDASASGRPFGDSSSDRVGQRHTYRESRGFLSTIENMLVRIAGQEKKES
jgi:hypothetical protein